MAEVIQFAPRNASPKREIAGQSLFADAYTEDLTSTGEEKPGRITLQRLRGLFHAFGVRVPDDGVETPKVAALWKRISGLAHTAKLIQLQPTYAEILLAPLPGHKRRYVEALISGDMAEIEAAAVDLGFRDNLFSS